MQYSLFSEREAVWGRIQIAVSLGLTTLAFWGSYTIKGALPDELGVLFPFSRYLELLYVVLVIRFFLLEKSNLYRNFFGRKPFGILVLLTRTVLIGLLLLVTYIYLLRRLDIMSRLLIGLFAALDLSLLGLWHIGVHSLVPRFFRSTDFHRRRILIVGDGEIGREMVRTFECSSRDQLEVVGFLRLERDERESASPAKDTRVEGKPVLGVLEDLSEILRRNVIDEVIFALRDTDMTKRIRDYLMICEMSGVQARIRSNFFGSLIAKTRLDDVAGYQLLSFSTTPQAHWQLFFKEIFDRLGAAVVIVLLSPLLALVALMVRLNSPGPAIFRQVRCGLNGRRFECMKFRTMVREAEDLRAALESCNEMEGPVFKIERDPRVTGIGKFLRKYSLDELPQLFNIMRGEMSFVGPRPPIPEEVENYEPWQRRRLSMKPGLTCIWQVSGRNQVPFERWMEMDLDYIDRWSLKFDLWLLLRTLPAVLSARGSS